MVLQLGGPLQALFLAGAAHDVVTLAEANARALGAVLVPERDQLLIDVLDLVDESPAVRPWDSFCHSSPRTSLRRSISA